MNEYFASMADVHRILGVLDETDDRHPAADGKAKTVAGSHRAPGPHGRPRRGGARRGRLGHDRRLVQRTPAALLHDAAIRVGEGLPQQAPILAAGIGHWQIGRLAARLERPLVDWARLVPCAEGVDAHAVAAAAPACAVALLLSAET